MGRYEELVTQYKKRSKLADQYLRRLEKLAAEDKRYKGVKQFAYKRAMRDIESWSGEGAKRFSRVAPRTIQGVQAKLRDIERFLQSSTATKKGITKYYESRAKTMNERYGTSLNWEDMTKYYQRGLNETMDKLYGSKTALVVVGKIQKDKKSIQKAIKAGSLDEYIDEEFKGNEVVVRNRIKKLLKSDKDRKELKKAGIL